MPYKHKPPEKKSAYERTNIMRETLRYQRLCRTLLRLVYASIRDGEALDPQIISAMKEVAEHTVRQEAREYRSLITRLYERSKHLLTRRELKESVSLVPMPGEFSSATKKALQEIDEWKTLKRQNRVTGKP